MSGERKPGARNSKMPTRSSVLFSTGVPVSAQLLLREIEPHDLACRPQKIFDPLRFVENHEIEMGEGTFK